MSRITNRRDEDASWTIISFGQQRPSVGADRETSQQVIAGVMSDSLSFRASRGQAPDLRQSGFQIGHGQRQSASRGQAPYGGYFAALFLSPESHGAAIYWLFHNAPRAVLPLFISVVLKNRIPLPPPIPTIIKHS